MTECNALSNVYMSEEKEPGGWKRERVQYFEDGAKELDLHGWIVVGNICGDQENYG